MNERMAVFILEDALSVWKNFGKHLLFAWLFVSSTKTGTRPIAGLHEFFHRPSWTTHDERLMPMNQRIRSEPIVALQFLVNALSF